MVTATLRINLATTAGIAARVQGMRRYYALLLVDKNKARLVKTLWGDTILTEVDFPWEQDTDYLLCLQVQETRLRVWVGGHLLFDVEDKDNSLDGGGAAFVLEAGHIMSQALEVCAVKV
jgi:hypothetical protein